MARPKSKNWYHFAARISVDVWDMMNDYCSASGETKTAVVEKGIVMYVQSREQEKLLDSNKES